MKKAGKYLLFTGLIIGLLTGLSILITQKYIASKITSLLKDEVKKSGAGEFAVDSLKISLLTQSATAKNARVIKDRENTLSFKKLKLTFGLKDILDKVIYLNRLDLIDGEAKGVGVKSSTYKFIDHLTKPSKNKPVFKVKLLELRIENSEFTEEIKDDLLHGKGLRLKMYRRPDQHFRLEPEIKSLFLESKGKNFDFGKITGLMNLLNKKIEYKDFAAKLPESKIKAEGESISPGSKLTADASFSLNAKDLPLNFLEAKLNGKGNVSGTLARPILDANFKKQPNTPANLVISGFKLMPIDIFAGNFKLQFVNDSVQYIIDSLSASNQTASIKSSEPIRILNGKIDGKLAFNIQEINFENLNLKNAVGDLKLAEEVKNIKLALTANLGEILTNGLAFHNTDVSLQNEEKIWDFTAKHKANEKGFMEIKGSVDSSLKLQNLDFNFNDYAFAPLNINYLQDLNITGNGSFLANEQSNDLEGSGKIALSSRFFAGESALKGDFNLKDKLLSVSVTNPLNSIAAKLNLPLNKSKTSDLDIKLNQLKFSEYNPELQCLGITAEAQYSFKISEALNGDGRITADKINLGCEPYNLQLQQPANLEIKNGKIPNLNLILVNNKNQIAVSGSVDANSGLNLEAKTNANLQSFISFVPWLDDLRGELHTDVFLQGKFNNLKFDGQAKLDNAEFALERAGLNGTSFSGDFTLQADKINIDNFNGNVNGAEVNLSGDINPLKPKNSNLSFTFEELTLEPNQNIFLNASGIFNLAPDEAGDLTLAGELIVNDAVFRKTLGYANIKDFFIKKEHNNTKLRLPDIKLKTTIRANRNVFVVSNLLESELKAQLEVTGSMQEPVITGSLATLYGWFGLKNSRFSITAGRINFIPHKFEPEVDIVAETNVINRVGEPIYIILEARGSLTRPHILLSADNNLTEQEILTLLTTRGLYRTKTRANSISADNLPGPNNRQSAGQSLLGKLISGLTRVDSISLEPAFNNKTGLIEPSIIATKELTDDFRLTSESFVGGNNTDNRFSASYDLTNDLTLAGIIDTITTQQNTALEANVSYTVLAQKEDFLDIHFKGNFNLSKRKFLKALRLNSDSQIQASEIYHLKEDAIKYLVSKGYFNADVEISCKTKSEFCREMTLELNPQKQYFIESIKFRTDNLPEEISIKELSPDTQVASHDYIDKLNQDLITALRSEGYLKARVKTEYLRNENDQIFLVIDLQKERPVSFIFEGNTLFSDQKLLESINVFKRQQAFGNNTINILLENIEKMYREQGYLYTTISHTAVDYTQRTIYKIKIREEDPIENILVEINGIDKQQVEKLKKAIEEDDHEMQENIFSPDSVLEEEIQYNTYYLRSIYDELGYENAEVEYTLTPLNENNTVKITYNITLNDPFYFEKLKLHDLPQGTNINAKITAPYSIPKLNRYLDVVLDQLKKDGFLEPGFRTEIDYETQSMEVFITADKFAKIENVECKNNQIIECDTILKNIELKPGEQYTSQKVNNSRSQLLKTGLFQRVFIETEDGKVNSENEKIIIRVQERPLNTLDLGLGLNSELGLHVFGEATDKRIFKNGRIFSIRVDGYYDESNGEISQGIAGLRYRHPNFFNTGAKFTKDLGFQKFNNPTLEYDLDRLILDTSLQKGWTNGIGLTLGHSILHEDLNNVTPDAIISRLDYGQQEISFIYGSLSYDGRNDPLNPQSGFYTGLDYKFAFHTIGSDADFSTLSGKVSWIYPIANSNFSIANNTTAGSSNTFNNTPAIPITQRFYSGGRNSIRGFRENSLGPRGENGAVLGGDFIFGNNFELRYLASQSLSLHTFLDSGNVFLQDGGIDFNELRYSTGLGFRYLSPIGPIGFDFGHPLDEKEGEPSWRAHFSVGSVF